MTVDAASQAEVLPRRPRFSFSLRSVFVLVTIFCLWLSYKSVSKYHSRQIVARHNAFVGALARNIATPPPNTSFKFQNPQTKDEILVSASWPDGVDPSSV